MGEHLKLHDMSDFDHDIDANNHNDEDNESLPADIHKNDRQRTITAERPLSDNASPLIDNLRQPPDSN